MHHAWVKIALLYTEKTKIFCYSYVHGCTRLLSLKKGINSWIYSTFGLFAEKSSMTRGHSLLLGAFCSLLMPPFLMSTVRLNANDVTFTLMLFVGSENSWICFSVELDVFSLLCTMLCLIRSVLPTIISINPAVSHSTCLYGNHRVLCRYIYSGYKLTPTHLPCLGKDNQWSRAHKAEQYICCSAVGIWGMTLCNSVNCSLPQ